MNRLIFILVLVLFACNQPSGKRAEYKQKYDCGALNEKKVILEIAESIIKEHDNENIVNLSEIDTAEFFTIEDYFTSTEKKNRLALIGAQAGLSAGSANNLLILFSCSDSLNVLWAGQVGDFNQSDIRDLNGDGIKEIVCQSGMMWMGECNDSYEIFNFKDGKQNSLFSALSRSVLDCGLDNISSFYKQGDTLQQKFECSLIKMNDKTFNVQQIQTVKVHNGGLTDEDIIRNLKVEIGTTSIELK